MLYYQPAKLPIEYCSKLNLIYLLGICKTDHVKTFRMNQVFEPLVKDLKVLGIDRGYPFSVFGRQVFLRAVLVFLADTPASNLGAGFKESVGGARRKSCHCMAT